jgi:hypothetical protein
MTNELLGITTEASQLVDFLMRRFRTLSNDGMLQEFMGDQQITQLRAICNRLEVFVDTHYADIPSSLVSCLRFGGHFGPFLLLLEEAAQSNTFRSGTWPQFLNQADKLALKIASDIKLIHHTLTVSDSRNLNDNN